MKNVCIDVLGCRALGDTLAVTPTLKKLYNSYGKKISIATHHPEIFEAMPKLGGMIRYGIPEYRLPKKVLDWEIEGILNLGIVDHTNVRLGVDFDFGSLS